MACITMLLAYYLKKEDHQRAREISEDMKVRSQSTVLISDER